MTHRDESRLPKWVQGELTRLRRDIGYYQKKLSVGPEDSDTFADPYADAPRPLGEGTTIMFDLNKDKHEKTPTTRQHQIRARIAEDHRGNKFLDVSGGDSLAIRPSAGNVVRIYTDRI